MSMPQGETGLEAGAWGAEWVTKDNAADFHDRTRNSIESHYATDLPSLAPWQTARDALFDTLMSGFNSIDDFIGDLALAVTGAVNGTLATIGTFMTGFVNAVSKIAEALGSALTTLVNSAGQFVANIANAIVDGVATFGEHLSGLWDSLTNNVGTPSTGKSAANVATAARSVRADTTSARGEADRANNGLTLTLNELYEGLGGSVGSGATGTPGARTPADVRTRGAAVRDSARIGENYYYAGANILINPGFEDTSFAILNQGVAVTANVGTGDVARSGTRSLRLVAAAGNPISYLAANTTAQVYLPCTEGETYYLECWVRGKSTNTQASAAGGIILGVTTYDSAKATPVNVALSFDAGTAYNADWLKVSGKVVVPAGKSFFTPYVGLSSSTVTNGHTYYFDDVVVREVTDSTASQSTAELATDTGLTNSSEILALQATQSGAANSGYSGSDTFVYTSTSSLNSGTWTRNIVGSGGNLGANGTDAYWVPGTPGGGTTEIDYWNTPTIGDYQTVTMVLGNMGDYGSVQLYSRMDSGRNNFIRLTFTKTNMVLEKVIAGTPSPLGAYALPGVRRGRGGTTASWLAGDKVELISGGTNLRQHIVKLNSAVVIDTAATDTTSVVSDNNRYAGLGMSVVTFNSQIAAPGRIAAWSVFDNTPPSVVGSGFLAVRTSTGTQAMASGNQKLSNNWFNLDAPAAYSSLDISHNLTNNRATFSIEGWYQVTVNLYGEGAVGIGGGGNVAAAIYKNGSSTPLMIGPNVSGNINVGFQSPSGSFLVYLKPNETLEPGWSSTAWTGGGSFWKGSNTGLRCWWSAALVNRSLL